MYIFGYFFQKGHFQGSSKKRHIDKNFSGGDGGEGVTTPLPP